MSQYVWFDMISFMQSMFLCVLLCIGRCCPMLGLSLLVFSGVAVLYIFRMKLTDGVGYTFFVLYILLYFH